MAFNPLTLLQERQCAPVYDALDSGKPSQALKLCDSLLSSQPNLYLASALKSIALIRLARREEASTLLDSLLSSNVIEKNISILTPMCMALTLLNRTQDEVKLLDNAVTASPSSVDIGAKAFTAMIKAKEWQKAQQTSMRLHKLVSAKDKSNVEYFWSSMQAYSLVASDASLPGSQLALPLAQRMIAKHLETHPIGPNSDEIMFLYATILRKMGGTYRIEALKLLNSEERGKDLCKRSMTLAMLRCELMEECNEWQTIYDEALAALEQGERNWSRVQEAMKASLLLDSIQDIESRLLKLSQVESKDRTMKLAPLYLIKEARGAGKAETQSSLLDLFLSYYHLFSTKACAYEDLTPYVPLLSEQEIQSALQVLQQDSKQPANRSFTDLNNLYISLNACKLARLMQQKKDTTAESEVKSGQDYFALYLCAVPLGKDLPKTEMQPGDDFALLSAQALVHASVLQREWGDKEASSTLLLAIVILNAALQYSPRGYRLRVLLIQLLRQYGHIDLARKEYEEIGIKAIQQDTLGWLLASRSSTLVSLLKPESKEQDSFSTAMRKLGPVWKEGGIQVLPVLAKSFTSGIFSRVEEIVDFGQRLDNSLAKWLHIVESARHPALPKKGNILSSELLECSASLLAERVSDQQDYHVLLNLMPISCRSIEELTSMSTATHPRLKYLQAMLPVAMLHQGVTIDNAAPSATLLSRELTETETLLSCLATALSQDDEVEIDSASSNLFKAVQTSLDTHCDIDLPCLVLCSVSIALEAHQLLCAVNKRRAGKLEMILQTSQSFLSSIGKTLQKLEWDDRSSTMPKEWSLLFNKLPSALRNSDDGSTVMRRKSQELASTRQNALHSLLDSIRSVIRDAATA